MAGKIWSQSIIDLVAGGGFFPNRPSVFTQTTELNFSQTPSSGGDDQVDHPLAGTDWLMWGYGVPDTRWTKISDATAPKSPPDIFQGHWAPGSYGGGIIGEGGGHGIGNVFTYGPNAVWANVAGITRCYFSFRCYFNFPDTSYWHPISNKFVNIAGNHSLILMQLNEGGNWRHAEELGADGFPSFGVDNNTSVGDTHLPGQIDNRVVPINQWVHFELVVDLPNNIFKVWQDGVLTTDATPTFASTTINTIGVNAFRGGGGETLDADLYYNYDHFFVAW